MVNVEGAKRVKEKGPINQCGLGGPIVWLPCIAAVAD